jgi:hypothetical protein
VGKVVAQVLICEALAQLAPELFSELLPTAPLLPRGQATLTTAAEIHSSSPAVTS